MRDEGLQTREEQGAPADEAGAAAMKMSELTRCSRNACAL